MPWQDFSNPASFFFWLVRFNVHISRFHELQHRMVNGPAYVDNSSCFHFLALFPLPGLGWVRNDLSNGSWVGSFPSEQGQRCSGGCLLF